MPYATAYKTALQAADRRDENLLLPEAFDTEIEKQYEDLWFRQLRYSYWVNRPVNIDAIDRCIVLLESTIGLEYVTWQSSIIDPVYHILSICGKDSWFVEKRLLFYDGIDKRPFCFEPFSRTSHKHYGFKAASKAFGLSEACAEFVFGHNFYLVPSKEAIRKRLHHMRTFFVQRKLET